MQQVIAKCNMWLLIASGGCEGQVGEFLKVFCGESDFDIPKNHLFNSIIVTPTLCFAFPISAHKNVRSNL